MFSLEGHSSKLHSSPPTNITEYFYALVRLQHMIFLFLVDKANSRTHPFLPAYQFSHFPEETLHPSPNKPQLWMLVSQLSSHMWVYSLGVIGKSRKSWLRETIEMTVEYIKAVAAHLRCHHQVLGAVGSSIGPSKWAQSS